MAFPTHAPTPGRCPRALLWTHNHKVSGDKQASLRERSVEQAGTREHFARVANPPTVCPQSHACDALPKQELQRKIRDHLVNLFPWTQDFDGLSHANEPSGIRCCCTIHLWLSRAPVPCIGSGTPVALLSGGLHSISESSTHWTRRTVWRLLLIPQGKKNNLEALRVLSGVFQDTKVITNKTVES